MKKHIFALGLSTMLFALCFPAEAQQPAKVPRIGYLSGVSPAAEAARRDAFNQGLRELGYIEGKTVVVEYRYSGGKSDHLASLAAELLQLKPDIIVTGGSPSTRAAKAATNTIPIVMTNDPDPLANGLIASLARPGGNITGLATLAPELSGKRLEILREVVANLSRVAVLGTSTSPAYAPVKKEIDPAAHVLKLQLYYRDVLDFKDIESAFRTAAKDRAEAVLTLNSGILNSQRSQIVNLAAKYHFPAIYTQAEYVRAGGLMYYGVNLVDLSRRAATYVDKILKGAKPADLPVEQARTFEFIVNLKAAKQIGLAIPPNVLARATTIVR